LGSTQVPLLQVKPAWQEAPPPQPDAAKAKIVMKQSI